jgi:8-oxo-dGTP pyrophosphatase MutT (NUDIX family)
MKTLITDIPKGQKRGWIVSVNDEVIEDVRSLRIESPHGKWYYGMTPGGWDGVAVHEPGGGGSVSVPFAMVKGQLWLGMVEQVRPYQGGPVLNLPRGYMDPGKNHFETVVQELEEEARLSASDVTIIPLPGAPCNPNSAVFVTTGSDEGVHFYAVEISERLLEFDEESGEPRLRPDVLMPKTKQAEQICQSRFVPWSQAMESSDMFTVAGAGRLRAYLTRAQSME